jgi:hypothetical protein
MNIYEGKEHPYYSWKGMVINAIARGYYLSVNDGEEWQVSKSQSFYDISEAVNSVDECRIAFWSDKKAFTKMDDETSEERHSVEKDGKRFWLLGGAHVVLWNELHESVSDTTSNEYMSLICDNVNYDRS